MLPIVQTSRRSSCVLNRLPNPYALHYYPAIGGLASYGPTGQ
jgi:hypothetical protein